MENIQISLKTKFQIITYILSSCALAKLITTKTFSFSIALLIISGILFIDRKYNNGKDSISFHHYQLIISAFIALGFMMYRYWDWLEISVLIDNFGSLGKALSLLLLIICGVASIPALLEMVIILFDRILEVNFSEIIDVKKYVKEFIICFFIYLFSYISIIRANYYYMDDIARSFYGYKSWKGFSRYLTDFLSNFIHTGNYIDDISPLPQMLSCVFLAITAVILLNVLNKKEKYNLIDYLCIVPIGVSPYFLECISYKIDSVYMAISIFVSVVPILLLDKNKKPIALFVSSFLCTLVACTTYQASLGILLMAINAFVFISYIGKKHFDIKIKDIFALLFGYGISIITFMLFIMKKTNTNSYIQNSLPQFGNIIKNTIDNFRTYFLYIIEDLNKFWILIIALICIALLCIAVFAPNKKKLFNLSLALEFIIVTLLLSFGLYPFLQKTLFEPRAMYGFGMFLSLLFIAFNKIIEEYKVLKVLKLLVFMLSCTMITLSYCYGNCLYVQKEYTNYKITQVANDINNLYPDDDQIEFHIEGSIGLSPALTEVSNKNPILKRLIRCTFMERSYFGYFGILHYYDLPIYNDEPEDNFNGDDLPVLKNTNSYTIKGDNSHALVILK